MTVPSWAFGLGLAFAVIGFLCTVFLFLILFLSLFDARHSDDQEARWLRELREREVRVQAFQKYARERAFRQ